MSYPTVCNCIALGWRFVDWPLPITATRTTTRSENRTKGSRDQRNHHGEPGPRECPVKQGSSTLSLERQVRSYRVQPSPPLPHPPPPLQGSLGRNPPPPSTELPLPPRKLSSRIDLGENLVLASKSGSEIMVRAQDDRMKHFWLNGISL